MLCFQRWACPKQTGVAFFLTQQYPLQQLWSFKESLPSHVRGAHHPAPCLPPSSLWCALGAPRRLWKGQKRRQSQDQQRYPLAATRDPFGDAGLLWRVSGSVGGCAGRVGEPTGYSPGAPPNQSETDMGHILLFCSDRISLLLSPAAPLALFAKQRI